MTAPFSTSSVTRNKDTEKAVKLFLKLGNPNLLVVY